MLNLFMPLRRPVVSQHVLVSALALGSLLAAPISSHAWRAGVRTTGAAWKLPNAGPAGPLLDAGVRETDAIADPARRTALLERAAYIAARAEDWERAVALRRKLRDAAPGDPLRWLNLGIAEKKAGKAGWEATLRSGRRLCYIESVGAGMTEVQAQANIRTLLTMAEATAQVSWAATKDAIFYADRGIEKLTDETARWHLLQEEYELRRGLEVLAPGAIAPVRMPSPLQNRIRISALRAVLPAPFHAILTAEAEARRPLVQDYLAKFGTFTGPDDYATRYSALVQIAAYLFTVGDTESACQAVETEDRLAGAYVARIPQNASTERLQALRIRVQGLRFLLGAAPQDSAEAKQMAGREAAIWKEAGKVLVGGNPPLDLPNLREESENLPYFDVIVYRANLAVFREETYIRLRIIEGATFFLRSGDPEQELRRVMAITAMAEAERARGLLKDEQARWAPILREVFSIGANAVRKLQERPLTFPNEFLPALLLDFADAGERLSSPQPDARTLAVAMLKKGTESLKQWSTLEQVSVLARRAGATGVADDADTRAVALASAKPSDPEDMPEVIRRLFFLARMEERRGVGDRGKARRQEAVLLMVKAVKASPYATPTPDNFIMGFPAGHPEELDPLLEAVFADPIRRVQASPALLMLAHYVARGEVGTADAYLVLYKRIGAYPDDSLKATAWNRYLEALSHNTDPAAAQFATAYWKDMFLAPAASAGYSAETLAENLVRSGRRDLVEMWIPQLPTPEARAAAWLSAAEGTAPVPTER